MPQNPLSGEEKRRQKTQKILLLLHSSWGGGSPFKHAGAPLPSFSGKGRFSRQILVGVPCTATEPRYVVFFSVRETELSGRGSEIKYAHGEEGIFFAAQTKRSCRRRVLLGRGGRRENNFTICKQRRFLLLFVGILPPPVCLINMEINFATAACADFP